MNDLKIVNTVLIEKRLTESRLNQTEWADLLGVNRGTFAKYRSDWMLMPLGHFVQMCRYLGVSVGSVLWYAETSVRLDYMDVRETDCITGREMEMIQRDNVSSELDLQEYFGLSLTYIRELKAGTNVVSDEGDFCCIPHG